MSIKQQKYIYLQETLDAQKRELLFNAALLRGDDSVVRHFENAAEVEAAITRSTARLETYPALIDYIKRRIADIEAGRAKDEEIYPFDNWETAA